MTRGEKKQFEVLESDGRLVSRHAQHSTDSRATREHFDSIAAETPSKRPDVRHGSIAVTPLPKRELMAVIAIQFCEGVNISSLFPYMTYMVHDFGVADEVRTMVGCSLPLLVFVFHLEAHVSQIPLDLPNSLLTWRLAGRWHLRGHPVCRVLCRSVCLCLWLGLGERRHWSSLDPQPWVDWYYLCGAYVWLQHLLHAVGGGQGMCRAFEWQHRCHESVPVGPHG